MAVPADLASFNLGKAESCFEPCLTDRILSDWGPFEAAPILAASHDASLTLFGVDLTQDFTDDGADRRPRRGALDNRSLALVPHPASAQFSHLLDSSTASLSKTSRNAGDQ